MDEDAIVRDTWITDEPIPVGMLRVCRLCGVVIGLPFVTDHNIEVHRWKGEKIYSTAYLNKIIDVDDDEAKEN